MLLSGGTGSRLWPLSREHSPKQLLRLIGDRTLLQQTALRAADPELFDPPMVVGSVEHRFLIAEQLREIGAPSPTIVLEPCGRNTAAAAAIAALLAIRDTPDAMLLVMPADHRVHDAAAFAAAVADGAAAAAGGSLVLFGIKPDAPATGYGYIRTGEAIPGLEPARKVVAFVEKPDRNTAQGYLESGRYLWNSGIFLLAAQSLISELERHAPSTLRHAGEALDRAARDADFLRLDREAFSRCPDISLDYAVMERTERAAVVPADFGWTDVGSWSTLFEIAERDASGNALVGEVLAESTQGSYIRSEGPLVATLGVEGLIIVATADAVLVADAKRDQDIRRIVERLRADKSDRI